ncbi:glucose-1-phosphate cytidylyltransferase [Marine Group I thaumarchaeote]|uniref:Glucose-1-phosphate cytidylyltransferase n=1 Tax=Marine Group I thaumarchaeote TaxID=2511932 RepID=A0A7K4NLK6_9ARCH|nr:glucose-1-phosphate cytidylyltransferase [Marine Group I thaumarchaeote]
MKAVILAGGYGTRISEESSLKPKPMIEIGGKPILWHILKIYSNYGINEFIICCGYKGNKIKEYFGNIDSTLWDVELVDTGLHTMTGGRLKRIQDHIDDTFCVTYGDGLSDIDINNLISFHREKKSLATLTAIHPPERFGVLNLSGDYVTEFHEKHSGESSWINGGFFVFEPGIFDYLRDDSTVLEKTPLETLAKEKKLSAFKHDGFWYSMDTLRDKKHLENLWTSNKAPWKTW